MSVRRKRYGKRKTLAMPAPIRLAAPWLTAVLVFLVCCLAATDTIKGTALIVMLVALVAGAFCFRRLRERVHLPLILLALYVLMDFISTFYAPAGKFALHEFLKVMTAFSTVIALLALTPGEGTAPGRRIATFVSRVTAIAGFVSIDLISTRWISTAVVWFLSRFGNSYTQLEGLAENTRMLSLFTYPNAFATMAGIGVLLSLGLAVSSETVKERACHVVCLFISALSFVLVFSMGGSGFIVVALIVYLLLERKEHRTDLFVLMVEMLVLTGLAVIPISMTSMKEWTQPRFVPVLCTVAGSVLIFLSDRFAGQKLAGKLKRHIKLLLIVIAALLVAVLILFVVACSLTGPVDIAKGDNVSRSIYLDAGEYTLESEYTGGVVVSVRVRTEDESLTGNRTLLYRGELSEATFTVPEGSLVAIVNFTARNDAHIEQVTYHSENGSGEIPLDYKLLPDFISNRIQGVFTNYNMILRFVYFRDGLRLFLRNPIAGLGIGGFENAVASVQEFYYESKYVHNHYIQTLVETGLIGFILFVGLIVVSAIAVLKSRKREQAHPLTPALGAALVFAALHAFMEVSFSYYCSLPILFCLFGLINLCCGESIARPALSKKVKGGALAVIGLYMVVFLVLLCGNLTARSMSSKTPTFNTLVKAVDMDRYERADYMLSYVISSSNATDYPEIQEQAAEYAERLEKISSNTIPIYLAEYYFRNSDPDKAMSMVEKYVAYVSGNPDAWKQAFNLLQRFYDGSAEFRDGVLHIAQMLADYNATSLEEIVLSEENRAFLAQFGA